MDESIEVVNIVATGELDTTVNLEHLYEALDEPDILEEIIVRYDPVSHQGLYIRFYEDGPLITVYNSGKYIIRASSIQIVNNQQKKLIILLKNAGVPERVVEKNFSVNNVVANANLNREIEIETLGNDLTNYDSEIKQKRRQLVYRMSDFNCTLVIFRTGAVILTGSNSIKKTEEAWQAFIQEVDYLFHTES